MSPSSPSSFYFLESARSKDIREARRQRCRETNGPADWLAPGKQMMRLGPYLTFNGCCEAAFKFYERCLGGKIEAMVTHGETPAAEHIAVDWRPKIMHARLTAGDAVLLGSDVPSHRPEGPPGFSVALHFSDATDAERVFQALSENGTVRIPIRRTFWAARFGMLVDQFGTPWTITCDLPMESRPDARQTPFPLERPLRENRPALWTAEGSIKNVARQPATRR